VNPVGWEKVVPCPSSASTADNGGNIGDVRTFCSLTIRWRSIGQPFMLFWKGAQLVKCVGLTPFQSLLHGGGAIGPISIADNCASAFQ